MVWVRRIEWSDASIEHIDRHGVETFDVEEVVFGNPHQTRARERRYRMIGQAISGRFLTVFLEPIGDRGVFFVATARDATNQERRLLRRR